MPDLARTAQPRAVGIDLEVPDLAPEAVRAALEQPVADDAATDAGAEGHEQDLALIRAPRRG